MKITQIETIPVMVPINPARAIKSGRGYHKESLFLLLKIHTDEGIIGLGEVSYTPHWSGEDQHTSAHLIQHYLVPLLIGEEPTQMQRLIQLIQRSIANNPFTKAGLEMAFWDILGKVAGLPVYRLLRGAVRCVILLRLSSRFRDWSHRKRPKSPLGPLIRDSAP